MGLLEELLHPLQEGGEQRSARLLRGDLEGLQRLALLGVESRGHFEDEPVTRVAVAPPAEVGHALAAHPYDLMRLAAGAALPISVSSRPAPGPPRRRPARAGGTTR